MITNKITTGAAVRALTKPQRQAMIDHLAAWAQTKTHGPLIEAVGRLEARVMKGRPTEGPGSDCEILTKAVFLNPARGLIPEHQLAILTRAWTKLGWAWAWEQDFQMQAWAAEGRVLDLFGEAAQGYKAAGSFVKGAGEETMRAAIAQIPSLAPKNPPLTQAMIRRVLDTSYRVGIQPFDTTSGECLPPDQALTRIWAQACKDAEGPEDLGVRVEITKKK
jgi:hypothetical protein